MVACVFHCWLVVWSFGVCVCDQSIYSWYSWTYRWWTIFQYVRQNLWIIKQPIDPPGSASLRLRDFAAELFAAFEAKVPGRRLITCALGKRGNLVFFFMERWRSWWRFHGDVKVVKPFYGAKLRIWIFMDHIWSYWILMVKRVMKWFNVPALRLFNGD